MRRLSLAVLVLALPLAGCPSEPGTDAGGRTDTPTTPRDTGPDAPLPPVDAGPEMTVAGGDVTGTWCGALNVTGDVTVPSGQTLTVCAGAQIRFDAGVGITVAGTLAIEGTAAARVRFFSDGTWTGITATGSVDASFVDVTNAQVGVRGAGDLSFLDSSITAPNGGAVVATLPNGGTFDRTRLIGGGTIAITGGILRMTDSVIDQLHPPGTPDCTDWAGGGMILDHVQITGCHCPIHINSADEEVTITNSILDGAANPIMIADCTAEIHHNNFSGTSTLVLDIGSRDNPLITANVSDNYWDGGPVNIGTTSPSQFTGTDVFSMTPFTDVGPR